MADEFDLFVSHYNVDRPEVERLVAALTARGVRTWVDWSNLDTFESITRAISQGLAHSKACLAYYSTSYPLRRACQWELTHAIISAQQLGEISDRVFAVSPDVALEHIQPSELRDARIGIVAPHDDRQLADVATSLCDRTRRLVGTLGHSHAYLAPEWFGWNGLGSTRFVGRMQDLWAIHSKLTASQSVAVSAGRKTPTAQVCGLGGIGKTLLLEEYALRFSAAYPGGVFWLHAHGNDDLADRIAAHSLDAERGIQVIAIARTLLPDRAIETEESARGMIRRHIDGRGLRVLWIVDDLPSGLSATDVRRWLAPSPLARTVWSTRSRAYAALADTHELGGLRDHEALELLKQHRAPEGQAEADAAVVLLRLLGNHPLAIEVAGAALRTYSGLMTYVSFLGELRNTTCDELDLAAQLSGALPTGHEASICKTLLMSIGRLGVGAHDVLAMAAQCVNGPIRKSLLARAIEKYCGVPEAEARSLCAASVHQLTQECLCEPGGHGEHTISVHPLVGRLVRHSDLFHVRCAQVRDAMVSALIDGLHIPARRPFVEEIAPDVPHAAHLAEECDGERGLTLQLLVAEFYHATGAFHSACALLPAIVERSATLYGPDDARSLRARGNLAVALQRAGRRAEGNALLNEVVARCRTVLGDKHELTLSQLGSVAYAFEERGEYGPALRIYERVVDTSIEVLGLTSQATARAFAALAHCLVKSGYIQEAHRLLPAETLDAIERARGATHPAVIQLKRYRSSLLFESGDTERAIELIETVFPVVRARQGDEHPDMLGLMSELGWGRYLKGRHAEARELQEEVIETGSRTLGREHPLVLYAKNYLGLVLLRLDEPKEARRVFQEVVDARRERGERTEPAMVKAMGNLAIALETVGEVRTSRLIRMKVYHACQTKYGIRNSLTTVAAHNLVGGLFREGKKLKAALLYGEAIAWLFEVDEAALSGDQQTIRRGLMRRNGH